MTRSLDEENGTLVLQPQVFLPKTWTSFNVDASPRVFRVEASLVDILVSALWDSKQST